MLSIKYINDKVNSYNNPYHKVEFCDKIWNVLLINTYQVMELGI